MLSVLYLLNLKVEINGIKIPVLHANSYFCEEWVSRKYNRNLYYLI